MVIAKCLRCLGSGVGSTLDEASSRINHGVGLTRGIPCGTSLARVVEVESNLKPIPKKPTPKKTTKTTKPTKKSSTTSSKESKE